MNRNVNFSDDAALLQLQVTQPQRWNFLQYWFVCHIRALLFACNDFIKNPFSNIITLLVIGITFSLPVSLFCLLQNVKQATSHWNSHPKIALYLKKGISKQEALSFVHALNANKFIASTRYVSPGEGLNVLSDSENTSALSFLKENPLPAVIEVSLKTSAPEEAQIINAQLKESKLVAMSQMNLSWIRRFYYFVDILKQLVFAISAFFCCAMILIIGNTIRLDMKRHHDEIEVLQLIGATKRFIQRPLLYRGLLYGVLGGTLAWLLSSSLLQWLQGSVSYFALSYSTNFKLQGLTFFQGILLVFISGMLSYIGALCVSRYHLKHG